MTERQALVGAGAAHLLLFAALSVGWSMLRQPPVIEDAVPVELVDIAPETKVTERPQPSKAAAPQETAAPDPAPEVAKPEPPVPVEAVPLPEPKPVEKAAPAKPKPDKPAARPKAEAKPQRLDTAELDSLIDKALPKAAKRVRDPDDFAKSIALSIPKSAKLDARASASLAAAIRARMLRCWNPPIGGADAQRTTALVAIALNRDGSVAAPPHVLSRTGGGDPAYAKAFADSAVRAVYKCAPWSLPPEMYDGWKAFELNFDPRDLG